MLGDAASESTMPHGLPGVPCATAANCESMTPPEILPTKRLPVGDAAQVGDRGMTRTS